MRRKEEDRHSMGGQTINELGLMQDYPFDNEIATAILVGMSRIAIAITDVADAIEDAADTIREGNLHQNYEGIENSISAIANSISPDNAAKTIFDAMHDIAQGVMRDVKEI